MNKIKFFLWMMHHGRLKTSHYLNRIGITANQCCQFCGNLTEDIDHIFLRCTNVREFWDEIKTKNTHYSFNPNNVVSMEEWEAIWQDIEGKQFNSLITWDILLPFCFWNIWTQRNHNTFNKRRDAIPTSAIFNQAMEYKLIIQNSTTNNNNYIDIYLKWEPPPMGSFKLNVDGAVNIRQGNGGLGGVIRNHNGDWIIGFVCKTPNTNPTMVELEALRLGLQMAYQNNIPQLEVNTDSMQITNMLETDNVLYANILFECRSLIKRMGEARVTHIFREQNRLADTLSKEGMKLSVFGKPIFLLQPPIYAAKCCWADIIGTTYIRKTTLCNNNYGPTMDQTPLLAATCI